MLKIVFSKQYMKDIKRELKSSHNNQEMISYIIDLIANEEWKILGDEYRDHKLERSKRYKGCRECHVRPDLLLIYKVNKNKGIATLVRLGSHSTLFEAVFTNDEELEYL